MEVSKIIERSATMLSGTSVQSECMPSVSALGELLTLCRTVIFPEYYGQSSSLYYIGQKLEQIHLLLSAEISEPMAVQFIAALPEIKRVLMTDVEAVFTGDPAASGHAEVIFCYPAITAMLHHRIAHFFSLQGVTIIPRIISEMAHSATGIDIHPEAQIGEAFSIDHGTGVVIGQTTIIGRNVRLYQGVTLGARSFCNDADGNPMNTPRHPIIGDNVVIYSNTSVLGRITIGENSIIGGNVWLTESVPVESKITQSSANYNKCK